MKYLIYFVLFAVVGCGRGPATVPTAEPTKRNGSVVVPASATPPTVAAKPKDDGFTSDADLVKFKDEPASFKGKTIKVKAKYHHALGKRFHEPLRNTKNGALFEKIVSVNGNEVRISFTVDLSGIANIPNAEVGETLTVEFEVTTGLPFSGNIGKSISR